MIYYKIDILTELKKKGYNTTALRNNKLLSEQTIQNLRQNKPINFKSLAIVCDLLKLQPGQIIGNREEQPPSI